MDGDAANGAREGIRGAGAWDGGRATPSPPPADVLYMILVIRTISRVTVM
jgi:hypothetical protein